MSRPGKNIRVWDKSTNPGFAEGKEVSVMHSRITLNGGSLLTDFTNSPTALYK